MTRLIQFLVVAIFVCAISFFAIAVTRADLTAPTVALLWGLSGPVAPIDGLKPHPRWDGHAHGYGGYATREACEAKGRALNREFRRDGLWFFWSCDYTGS